jgi:hypothetical protein
LLRLWQTNLEKANTKLWLEVAEFLFYVFLLLLGELFFLADGATEYLYVLQDNSVNIEIHFDFNKFDTAHGAQ